MHIHCPHCRNAIQVIEGQELRDVTCPSCGSSFNETTLMTGGMDGKTAVWQVDCQELVHDFEEDIAGVALALSPPYRLGRGVLEHRASLWISK